MICVLYVFEGACGVAVPAHECAVSHSGISCDRELAVLQFPLRVCGQPFWDVTMYRDFTFAFQLYVPIVPFFVGSSGERSGHRVRSSGSSGRSSSSSSSSSGGSERHE